MAPPLRIGTRGSNLALAQTDEVAARLRAAHPDLAPEAAIEVVVIKTTGDRVQDRPLAEIGGKGLFTKEIEDALLEASIDLAVHSMKDMATRLPDGLAISAILAREDPRDVLIAGTARSIGELARGAVVGTASLRRRSQILGLRPDLEVVPFRGNVNTRLAKLERGEVDATILALAGLRRLAMSGYEDRAIPTEDMLPAVAQGAIGIETRAGDARVLQRIEVLDDAPSAVAVRAERTLLAILDGSCRTPIAAHARLDGEHLILDALIASLDGATIHRAHREGASGDAEEMGIDAGEELRAAGGPGFFDAVP